MFGSFFGRNKKSGKAEDKGAAKASTNSSKSVESKQASKSRTTNKNKPSKPKPVWKPEMFVVPPEEGKTRFHDLNLAVDLLHGIADLGYQYCSPIQAEALPHTLKGHDLIGKDRQGDDGLGITLHHTAIMHT